MSNNPLSASNLASTGLQLGRELLQKGAELLGLDRVIAAPSPLDRFGSQPGSVYTVKRGDTLSAIAKAHGTDVQTLARINGIANPDRISVDQQIRLPAGASTTHVVQRGDTLGAIAAANGTTVQALQAANPHIRNVNQIFPGDVIRIGDRAADGASAGASAGAKATGAPDVGGVTSTNMADGRLSLSQADIDNIKKTLQTEWVRSAGDAQARGIVDTILNRTASGRWGSTVADVVNARNQFSDINGPISRRDGRNSVDDLPMSSVDQRVSDFVDSYLAERAAGRPSSIGSHLNYANPHFSDARNLAWINALDGPVLGRGNAIHRHGTVPELQRYRPDAFAVILPGGGGAPDTTSVAPAPTVQSGGTINGREVAAANGVAVKNSTVALSRLDASMGPVIAAVAQAARNLGLPTPVITSGNDSRHSNGSLHYDNRALDFRGNNISIAQGRALQNEVRAILGSQYDVIFETFSNSSNNHLHVEFDPN